jgi:hypothetical protein
MRHIETSCIKVCSLDRISGLCRGCGRNIDEIWRWSELTAREHASIMTELPRRLAANSQTASAIERM